MKIQTERRKQIREAYQQEHPWWIKSLDPEMKRRLEINDKRRIDILGRSGGNSSLEMS